MISDPILLQTGQDHQKILNEHCKKENCKIVFYHQWLGKNHHYLALCTHPGQDTFCIAMMGNTKQYRAPGKGGEIEMTNKEAFVDFLSHQFPDHLEWLLFHPEFL